MRRLSLISLILPVIAAGALLWAPIAAAVAPPPMTVTVQSKSGTGNYFTVNAGPGQTATAGTILLRNPTSHPVTVHLDPVDGLTASTLGSAYGLRGSKTTGSADWVLLGQRSVQMAGRGTAIVPISVQVPSSARPGDYLAGIGVQAAQSAQEQTKGNLGVSSVQRYAVGVETMLPGPRHPQAKLTGVKLTREPAGVTFSLLARNTGNVILKNVHGSATVSDADGTVTTRKLGPGTFVTGTSIAYPLLVPSLHPTEGETFNVEAVMKYKGGSAHITKTVTFGQVAAKRQQAYGGPQVNDGGGKSHLLPILLILLVIGGALAALEYRRRRGPGGRSVRPALERAINRARANGEPLSVILVGDTSKQAAGVRSCLRSKDALFRANGSGMLVIAPDTTPEAGEVLATEIKRHLARGGNGNPAVIPVTSAAQSNADELLEAAAAVAPAASTAPPSNGHAGNGIGHAGQSEVRANGTEAHPVSRDDSSQYSR
jgi:hypothetical protein